MDLYFLDWVLYAPETKPNQRRIQNQPTRYYDQAPAMNWDHAVSWGCCCCCCCCLKKNQNAPRPSEHPPVRGYWLPARKKLLYTVANPARGLLNRGKKKKKSGSAPPPPPPRARCLFGEKIYIYIYISRGASTCLLIGATQVGVTQVVSVRLASVQGFLRLVG